MLKYQTMKYSILVNTYEKLEKTSSKLEKTSILANLFSNTPTEELPKVVLLAQGTVFPKFTGYELGIAVQMMIKAIAKSTGFRENEIREKFRKTGDLGLTAEECIKSRKQNVLFKRKLDVKRVFENLQKLAFLTGAGSQERKLSLIAELLVSAEPKEARYIVRTILEELRIGIAEGIIRDAIVKAFLLKEGMNKEEKSKITEAVDYAWNILSDFGEIAKIAKEKGIKGIKKVRVQVGKPIHVMLAEKVKNVKEAIELFHKCDVEVKYDGMRAQVHKKNDKVWIFTRRLEDVTKQFPDLVKLSKECLKAKECIVEGEVLGIDKKTGSPLPFQMLSQRIHRKYNIERMIKEIPIQMNLFDIVYLDGKMLFDKPLRERRRILESVVKIKPGTFQLTKMIITDSVKEAEKFYKEALKAKQEGIMVKNLDSPYIFGRHVGGWVKVKPIMETLDLAIIGATWGEGKRANWLSSYVLACRDPDTGNFLTCGMMGTGLTEEQFKNMTELLKPLILEQEGRKVKLRPKIVIEVAYQEIQKSPNYTSKFALRFPKLVRIRFDKSAEDADTIDRLRDLYKSQGRAG